MNDRFAEMARQICARADLSDDNLELHIANALHKVDAEAYEKGFRRGRRPEGVAWDPSEDDTDLDLHLLARLASGEGGRRTGALKRAGLLEWTVTDKGRAALAGIFPYGKK